VAEDEAMKGIVVTDSDRMIIKDCVIYDSYSTDSMTNTCIDAVTNSDWQTGCDWTTIKGGNGDVLVSDGYVTEWQPLSSPLPVKTECIWCSQVNKTEREQCRGCGAGLLEGGIA
jgi:hypothetical protein